MDLRALIFVPALVGAAICVFFFLTFVANYYLTVLEGTASGGRVVTWMPESITDNLWKPIYLAWLLCLWLGPAYVIGRSLAGKTGVAWVGLAVPVFVAWALYPVSQLSSLSASSVWIPLHPQVFARLAQKPMATIGFFLFTLPIFALAGIAFKWAFLTEREWQLLFVGMPLLALAVLLYARLLGQLAFALMFTRDILKRKKKKKPKKAKQRETESESRAEQESEIVQPSEMTPINTPDGELVGYNVLIADDPPPPKKRVKAEMVDDELEPVAKQPSATPSQAKPSHNSAPTWTDDDDDATPYDAKPAESQAEEHAPAKIFKPSAEEIALLDRSDAPKAPNAVWSLEIFAFLTQPGTITAIVILSGIGTLAGAAVRVARMFNPAAGE